MTEAKHTPVLLQKVIDILHPVPGKRFIDATANGGGHTFALWERIKPSGAILAIDKDSTLVESLSAKANAEGASITAVSGSYAHIADIARRHGFGKADGILFDLGWSSWHTEGSGRGFSFEKDEPLLMRYEPVAKEGVTARDVVNRFSEQELVEIFSTLGEERYAKRIARAICETRRKHPIHTSRELAYMVTAAYPKGRNWGRIHPATRVFQALRIFVNRELEELKEALPQAVEILNGGGTITVISFHSLEDRIVKQLFRSQADAGRMTVLTKKPMCADETEVKENPRSRSAKLRAGVKI